MGVSRGICALVAGCVLWFGAALAHAGDKAPTETDAQRERAHAAAEMLSASNKLEVKRGLEELGKIKGPTAAKLLMDYARKSKNQEWGSYATRELGWRGNTDAVEFLCGKYGVKSKKLLIAEAACSSLAAIGDKRAVPALLEAIKGKKVVVTRAAISAVVTLDPNTDGMSKLMVKLAKDKSPQVREVVATAMGKMTDDSVVPTLIKLATRDGNSIVRLNACNSLGTLRAAAARDALATVSDKDKSADVRRAAKAALLRLPAEETK